MQGGKAGKSHQNHEAVCLTGTSHLTFFGSHTEPHIISVLIGRHLETLSCVFLCRGLVCPFTHVLTYPSRSSNPSIAHASQLQTNKRTRKHIKQQKIECGHASRLVWLWLNVARCVYHPSETCQTMTRPESVVILQRYRNKRNISELLYDITKANKLVRARILHDD